MRLMPILTAIALLLVVSSADARLSAFKSPTGNITCVISTRDGGFAQCELRSKPYGGGLMVPSRGRVSRYDVASYDDIVEHCCVVGLQFRESADDILWRHVRHAP